MPKKKRRADWVDKQATASLERLAEHEWVLNTILANAPRMGNNRRATTVQQLVNWRRRPWKSYMEFPRRQMKVMTRWDDGDSQETWLVGRLSGQFPNKRNVVG